MPGKDMMKELKDLYSASAGRIVEVDAPPLDFLMLEGKGDPATAFPEAFGALFGVAFPLAAAIKARDASLEYAVMPPEALFTAQLDYATVPRADWPWTLLSLLPVKPTTAELEDAKRRAVDTGARLADHLRVGTLQEGHCVQTMHVGPYENEIQTITTLHEYMARHGFTFGGAHHEVYFSGPDVPPAQMRTLVRQPVVAKRVAAVA